MSNKENHKCEHCSHEFEVELVFGECGDGESGPRVECNGVVDEYCPECGRSIYPECPDEADYEADCNGVTQAAIDMGYYYK